MEADEIGEQAVTGKFSTPDGDRDAYTKGLVQLARLRANEEPPMADEEVTLLVGMISLILRGRA